MSGVHSQPQPGLWPSVWKLLRLQWRLFLSGLRTARLGRKIGYVALALTGLFVLFIAFAASWGLFSLLRSPELGELVDPAAFISAVPVLVTSAAFMVVLFVSFGVLLQALYLAGDMDFLLSAPLPVRAVFLAKLLQAILPSLALTWLFGLPVLLGLGIAGAYPVPYYPLVLIVLSGAVLAAAALASLLVMAAVRIVPARHIAEVLGLVGGIVSLLCSQSRFYAGSARLPEQQTMQTLSLLTRLNSPWSPLAWAGRGLTGIGAGDWLAGGGFSVLFLALVGGIFSVALQVAERLYYSGWARVQSGTYRKRVAHAPRPATAQPSYLAALVVRVAPAAVRGLIVKDLLVLRRDLRNLSQVIGPLILGVVYAVALLRSGGQMPAGRGEAPDWFMNVANSLLVYANVGIALFVGWSLLSRLAMMGFSQEGRHYWLLKTAPVSTSQLLAGKFLVAFLPTLALVWGFLLIISLVRPAGLATLWYGLPVVASCLAGVAGIDLAIGVAGANLEWDDPRRMVGSGTGCIGVLASGSYLATALALFFGPALLAPLLGLPALIGQIAGLVLGGGLSLACAILPLRLVRERVPRIGEA